MPFYVDVREYVQILPQVQGHASAEMRAEHSMLVSRKPGDLVRKDSQTVLPRVLCSVQQKLL